MITQFRVANFKALRDVTVDLEPLTVLIGPNDSGKSSFLEALYALGESTWSRISHCFWSSWQGAELVYDQCAESEVNFDATINPGKLRYSLSLSFAHQTSGRIVNEVIDGQSVIANNELTTVNQHKRNPIDWREPALLGRVANILHLPALARWGLEDLASPSRLPPDRRYPFDPSGYGLATAIAEIKLDDVGRFINLRSDFCTAFTEFKDIQIKRTTVRSVERDEFFRRKDGREGEGYSLYLVRTDGIEIPAGLVSGGMLITLAFLTLTHLSEPRKLLLIEEPENSLHPSRLKEIVEVLKRTVSSQSDTQIVLTTHSPLLLDYVEPHEVRVFLRNEEKNNDIEVYNVADVPDIKDRLKYLMLGELVYNEGERELVKEIQHAHSNSGGGAE